MFEWIWEWDLGLLYFFNVDLGNPVLDQFWRFITQMHKKPLFMAIVIPVLLGSLVYIYRKETWKPLLILGAAIGLADGLSYRLIKSLVFRLRPFQNPEISDWVRKVGEAHGPSFPSNHAANAFAAAAVLSWFWPGTAKYFYIIAGFIAMSRVALGVHYPSDVVAGMLLGLSVGFMIRVFILNQTSLFHLRKRISFLGDLSFTWRTRSRRMQKR